MPTKPNQFLIAIHDNEMNIIGGDFWEDDEW